MFIRDDAEVAFFIDNEINSNRTTQTDDICLWTDSKDLENSFAALFEDLWHDATDIQKRRDRKSKQANLHQEQLS